MNRLSAQAERALRTYGGRCQVIETPEGPCDSYHFRPAGSGPAVLFFCDAAGTRAVTFALARQLADAGYYVLMPNLYHRLGPYQPFDLAAGLFDNPHETQRLMAQMNTLTPAQAILDTSACLQALASLPEVVPGPIGCVGYCIGGYLAFAVAGHFGAHIGAAGIIHGARLATAAPDSPHLQAKRLRAGLYFAVAEIDRHFLPAERTQLQQTLQQAECDAELEVFAGLQHGFAMADMPSYDAGGAERYWQKLLALLHRRLG